MGLDMYLKKSIYVGNRHRKPEQQLKVILPESEEGITFPLNRAIHQEKISEIIEDVGYWRKANAIHRWFVDNMQSGEDDCGTYPVDRKQLQELLDTVNKVLEGSELVSAKVAAGYTYKNGKKEPIIEEGKKIKDTKLAEELLPCQQGFFFGGIDYDNYYYDDLVHTKEILEEALTDSSYADFTYHSSW